MKMKYEDLSNLTKRRNAFVVGGSGDALSRCTTFPQILDEFIKAGKETKKEYQNGKNQGK
ncbi:hypothetical protein [Bacillus nitratireducens]|uniref:hypothetical protein n=1 Tax=Bacillus nitratireducens TaxID=2026193 RepID=UPI00339B89A5